MPAGCVPGTEGGGPGRGCGSPQDPEEKLGGGGRTGRGAGSPRRKCLLHVRGKEMRKKGLGRGLGGGGCRGEAQRPGGAPKPSSAWHRRCAPTSAALTDPAVPWSRASAADGLSRWRGWGKEGSAAANSEASGLKMLSRRGRASRSLVVQSGLAGRAPRRGSGTRAARAARPGTRGRPGSLGRPRATPSPSRGSCSLPPAVASTCKRLGGRFESSIDWGQIPQT